MAWKVSENQPWKRLAVGMVIVGSVLTVGQWLPILGLDRAAMDETIAACSGRSPMLFWPSFVHICLEPPLVHKQLGGEALLGSAALVTFMALWVRRRWVNAPDA